MDVLDPVFLFVVVKFASNGILFSVDGVLKGIAPVAVSFNRFHNAITFKLSFIPGVASFLTPQQRYD